MGLYTPYILAVFGLIVSLQVWLVRRSYTQETDHKLLKQAFELYVENAGRGAAINLHRPNPAPEHIRPLLAKYIKGRLTDEKEREVLLSWARMVSTDKTQPADERSFAYGLVGTLGAEDILAPTKTKPTLLGRLFSRRHDEH